MNAINLYRNYSVSCSTLLTRAYSTSFFMGIRLFSKPYREPICSVYGFVRLADEIVDSFHDQDKHLLLEEFRRETRSALERKFSLNPILHAFQEVVHAYGIEEDLIEAFLASMEMDLELERCNEEAFNQYVYGSAEVVGLMCLRIFVQGDPEQYRSLAPYARALGSAFQKINFLRDLKSDYEERGRIYFPGMNLNPLTHQTKQEIEAEIEKEFHYALQGIRRLPAGVRLGVHVAYTFYWNLFDKIRAARATDLMQSRFRISNGYKLVLVFRNWFGFQLGKI